MLRVHDLSQLFKDGGGGGGGGWVEGDAIHWMYQHNVSSQSSGQHFPHIHNWAYRPPARSPAVLTSVSRLITAVCPSNFTDIWSPFVVLITASLPYVPLKSFINLIGQVKTVRFYTSFFKHVNLILHIAVQWSLLCRLSGIHAAFHSEFNSMKRWAFLPPPPPPLQTLHWMRC